MDSLRSSTDTDGVLSEIVDEIIERLDRGENPDLHEYTSRFPQLDATLRKTIPALLLLQSDAAHSRGPANAQEITLPLRIGEFKVIRQIGRGGMGIVYEAEQISMGRIVALKVLPFAALTDSRQIQRFRNEVRAAGMLEHPHIVSVYSIGEDQGVHYYAMQLIRGQSLARIIESLKNLRRPFDEERSTGIHETSTPHSSSLGEKASLQTSQLQQVQSSQTDAIQLDTKILAHDSTFSLPIDSRFFSGVATIGIQAAQALHHAHEQGVVHRDIKPANLMLDGEARLYITDFGLARIQTEANVTMTGDVIGTLRYMSPEQAMAKHHLIDHRTDIYSLGVSLYELLVLRPAFDGGDREELLKQIAFDEIPTLRSIRPDVPAELETILLKATAKDREQRYETAKQMADDLTRFLERRPILARRISMLGRVRKWAQRNTAFVVGTFTVLLLATSMCAAVIAISYHKERILHQRSQQQARETEKSLRFAREVVDNMYTSIALEWLIRIASFLRNSPHF